jgi:hypothetical protein
VLRAFASCVLIVGCTAKAEPPPDELIAMSEGEQLTRALHSPPLSPAPDWPPWATIASGNLVLAPPCDTVPGTSGPPELFSLDHVDGDARFVVQVSPSLAGTCLPRVLACVEENGGCTYQDQTTGKVADIRMKTHFCYGSSCTGADFADEVIHFKVENPDDRDTSLVARVTTDAPIAFRILASHFHDELVGDLYDANITGEFLASYQIARMPDATPVTDGTYNLTWNPISQDWNGFGIEAESCSAPVPGCLVRHAPTRTSVGQCLRAQTGTPVTIGLRVWIADTANLEDADRMYVGGPATAVFHALGFADPGGINLPLNSTEQSVTVDAGDVVGTDVTFQLWRCRSAGAGTAPVCAAPPIGPPDAVATIAVRSSLTTCP